MWLRELKYWFKSFLPTYAMASRNELNAYCHNNFMLNHFTMDLIEANVLVNACNGHSDYTFEKPNIPNIMNILASIYTDCTVTLCDNNKIKIDWS